MSRRIPECGTVILEDRYCLKGESVDKLLDRSAYAWATDKAMAVRIRGYLDKGWLVPSTPTLSNAPTRRFFEASWYVNMTGSKVWDSATQRGLPISCFVGSMGDSRENIFSTVTESGFASSLGGGLGICLDELRPAGSPTSRGSSSTGIIPFAQLEQSAVLAMSQGDTRRGSVAFWLSIDHPEIHEYLSVRREHGGDPSRKLLHSHHGIVISDHFLDAVAADGDWLLIDPNSKKITATEKARDLWFKLLEIRKETGEPMIFNRDRVDEGVVALGIEDPKDYRVIQSNLCSEILLHTSEDIGNVCCLSSYNLLYWEEFQDNQQFFDDTVEMLDNALEYFIHSAPEELSNIVQGAVNDRPLGLGTLGYFSLLQSKRMAVDELATVTFTRRIYSTIKERTHKASVRLADLRGVPQTCKEHGIHRRNLTLTAIAPNASSSIYAGVSPSVEPYASNVFTQKTLSGDLTIVNAVLDAWIREYFNGDEADIAATWEFIKKDNGSVANLDIMSPHDKVVFRTAFEHNQLSLVILQEHRQPFIDQGTSFNIFIPAEIEWEVYNAIHWRAAKNLKTLYYLRTQAGSRTNTNLDTTCIGCE